MPQLPVQRSPGSSRTRASPVLKASAGQLIGSMATALRPGRTTAG